MERCVDPAQHPPPGQLGEEPLHRVLEGQHAVVDEGHGAGGGDGLGDRGDAEDGVARQRRRIVESGGAEHLDVDVVAPRHEGGEPGNLATRDVCDEAVVEAIEAGRAEPAGHLGLVGLSCVAARHDA